jgi:hypothetical protein
MPIRSFISDGYAAFEPDAITAMSQALEIACATLQISARHERERRVVAERIIDLARDGIIDAASLSNRVIAEGSAVTRRGWDGGNYHAAHSPQADRG